MYFFVMLFGVAIFNVIISIPLANMCGGIGSAIGTAISFAIGHILIMNVYYHKKIHIDIIRFLKEILKMSIPVLVTFGIGMCFYDKINQSTVVMYAIEIGLYTIIYCLFMWNFGMNEYEKSFAQNTLNKVLKKNEG